MSRLFWIAALLLTLAACGKEEPAAPPVDEPVATDEPAAIDEAPVQEAVEAADEVIEAKGLKQITDTSAIEAVVDKVIAANPGQVAEYRAGKDKLFGFEVPLACPEVPEEILMELRRANRRTVSAVFGTGLVLAAAVIYGLDGYAPAMVLGAPLLSWLLAAAGLLVLLLGTTDDS